MSDRYRESLDYLYGLQLFGIKLGLDNIRKLLTRLGEPQQAMRIIHIAGTNGKGSTSAALASIFQQAGISAGLYTSPHLHHFTERIRIDTRQIAAAEAVALIDELRPHAQDLEITFFEFTTAMALLSFQRHQTPWAILETGMGGRLDATNVVTPELCVITPIALDHAGYLGPDLRSIAAEKAGIFKAGVPVLCAPQEAAVEELLRQRAAVLGCPFFMLGQDYQVTVADDSSLTLVGPGLELREVRPRLPGIHQFNNLALAAAAVAVLADQLGKLAASTIRAGLEHVCWPGRLEWLAERILLDGAHNQAGVEVLTAYLQQQQLRGLHLVFGCKADKQAEQMLARLLPFVARIYLTRPPDVAAVDPEKLMQQAEESGIVADQYPTPAEALSAAWQQRRPEDTILVAGSLFLIAAVRAELVADTDTLPIVI